LAYNYNKRKIFYEKYKKEQFYNIQLYFTEETTINKLNDTLIIDDMDGFTHVLKDPILNLNHLINEFAIPLYFEELKIDRCDIDVRL